MFSICNPFRSLTLVLLIAAPAVLAVNQMIIQNNCPYPIYYWVVEHAIHVPDKAYTRVEPYDAVSEGFRNPEIGGISVKLGTYPRYSAYDTGDGIPHEIGIVQMEYDYNDDGFWYDMSNIDCERLGHSKYCPFFLEGYKVETTEKRCRDVQCTLGNCAGVYHTPHPDPVYHCSTGLDLIFTSCSGSEHSQDLWP